MGDQKTKGGKMKVYIVCRSWCEGYEDHGWDIMGTCATPILAESKMVKMVRDRKEDPDDWWVDELEVEEVDDDHSE